MSPLPALNTLTQAYCFFFFFLVVGSQVLLEIIPQASCILKMHCRGLSGKKTECHRGALLIDALQIILIRNKMHILCHKAYQWPTFTLTLFFFFVLCCFKKGSSFVVRLFWSVYSSSASQALKACATAPSLTLHAGFHSNRDALKKLVSHVHLNFFRCVLVGWVIYPWLAWSFLCRQK